jgi:hypothetical protein
MYGGCCIGGSACLRLKIWEEFQDGVRLVVQRCQQIGNFAEALFLSLDQQAVLGYWINSHVAEGNRLLV